jgi:hypothetical protein
MDTEKKILYVMQAVILSLGFLYLAGVTFIDLSPAGLEHSKTVVGFMLGTVFSTIINFNWGGSKGSRDKTEADSKRLDVLLPAQIQPKQEQVEPVVEEEGV